MTRQRSFPIALLLLCVLICGVAGFVVYQRSHQFPQLSEENKAANEKRWRPILLAQADIEKAIEAYKSEHGEYPPSWDDLHITNFSSGVSTSYFVYYRHEGPRQGSSGYELDVHEGFIGVRYASHGGIRVINEIIPNSPAAKANLMPGDFILQVDGKDATQVSDWDFVSAVQGAPGTSVILTVRKKSSGSNETVALTREPMGSH